MKNSYQPVDADILAQYDAQIAAYYTSRDSNARQDTWSDHIRRTIIKENRPFILDYLHKQGGQCANSRSSCVSLRV